MTVSSLSSLYTSLYQTSTQSTNNTRMDISGLPQDAPPQISQLSSYISQLEELQSSDPEQYKEITAEIAAELQTAADEATGNGDTGQASALSDLADKFQTASEDGTMVDLSPPEGSGPMGGPPPGPPPSSDSAGEDSSDLASNIYQSLVSQFQGNSGNDPMSVLSGILESVFSSSGAEAS